jgi:hypothetical protein
MKDEYTKALKSYCYHCGKEILDERESDRKKHIHIECRKERDKIIYHQRGQRWLKLMSDPIIRKRIEEVDNEVLYKSKVNNKKVNMIIQNNNLK